MDPVPQAVARKATLVAKDVKKRRVANAKDINEDTCLDITGAFELTNSETISPHA